MKQIGSILMIIVLFFLSACYGGGGGSTGSSSASMALNAAPNAPNKEAATKNDEGVSHLQQEHFDTSLPYFKDALTADPNMAEAHFNLALAYDGMGKHDEATKEFKKAKELGAANPKIADNAVLKKHLGM